MHGASRAGATPVTAVQQCTWVYSAISFICEHIMRTPFVRFLDGRPAAGGGPIDGLLARPNEYGDQNSDPKFRYAYFFELLLNGAVMRVMGGMRGFTPTTMSVRPRRHFRADWRYDELDRMIPVRWSSIRTGKSFTPDDTINHDALYNPLHDFEGMSPLTAALMSAGNDISVVKFAERFFENDGSSGVVFSTDNQSFGQTQADAAQKAWDEAHAGADNAFNAKFVGLGLRPYQLGVALDGELFKVLRSLSKEEIISGIYKIPLDAISAKDGGGDIVIGGPSGGTQASAREAFLVNVVQPWAMRYDDEFNRDVSWRFGGGIEYRHDFTKNPILERRRLERAQAAVQLIDHGVPLNEVIRWLQLDIVPQPHGDDWWVENTFLPARIVMDAGDDAIKIAIPPTPAAPRQGPTENERRQVLQEYIQSIVAMAGLVSVKEAVRSDPKNRLNGHSPQDRILELTGGVGTPV